MLLNIFTPVADAKYPLLGLKIRTDDIRADDIRADELGVDESSAGISTTGTCNPRCVHDIGVLGGFHWMASVARLR